MVRWTRGLIAFAMILAVVTACTGDPGGGGFEPETLLRIEEPEDGAQVTVPFRVRVSSSVAIGENHSVQVFVDGVEGPRVSDESFELSNLEPGDHAIAVSLIDEQGNPVGGEDEVDVTVTGGGG